ncbi:MAG: C-type lectin domain-containing protein [Sandaracinaceae bacterium]|nr:C-type lectin domain-containing protein [Sandaracinaceae bacterium]
MDGGRDAGGDDAGRPDGGRDACVPTGTGTDGCNGRDDDCDGTIDEDCECTVGMTRMCGPCMNGVQSCGVDSRWGDCAGGTTPQTYYRDEDGDSFGNPEVFMELCAPMTGWVMNATDCDDECVTCTPVGVEICNGLDDDCDGTPDDGAGTIYYRDADGDGVGATGSTMAFCSPPGAGWTMTPGDCDDSCRLCRPGFPGELCGDGRDNNCDGVTDTSCVCDYFTAGGGEYLFCDTNESWANGRTRCMGFGGDLASFETRAEGDDVWAQVDPYNEDVWIGGSDIATEGMWVWVSGASIGTCNSSGTCSTCSMCNWRPGQPNVATQDCLIMPWDWSGQWGDSTCSNTDAVLCEL